MSFAASLVFSVISLCAGGVTGSLICIVCGKLFNRRFLKSHLTLMCVLLSIAIAFASGGFIVLKDLSEQCSWIAVNYLYFSILFFTGALSSCFWRVVLPVVILLYIILSVMTGYILYGKYGTLPDSASVMVSDSAVIIDNKKYFSDDIKNKALVVETYTLPSVLILPLPRVWYSVIGLIDVAHKENGNDIRRSADFSGGDEDINKGIGAFTYWGRKYEEYKKWLFSNNKNLLIPIPEEQILPVEYTLIYKTSGDELRCRLVRQL